MAANGTKTAPDVPALVHSLPYDTAVVDPGFDALTPLPERAYETVVVGAGFAGLSAAAELAEQGKAFLLLEARAESGGRVVRSPKDLAKNPAMSEMGAFFVYDQEMAQELTKRGAVVTEFPEGNFFEARNGKITAVPPEDFVLNHAEAVVGELLALPLNISLEEGLKQSETFQKLSADQQKIIHAYFNADIGAHPSQVGLSSLHYDSQTLGAEKEFFGVCTLGGLSNIAKGLSAEIPSEAKGMGALLTSVKVRENGEIELHSFQQPFGALGSAREEALERRRNESTIKTNSAILTLPLEALKQVQCDSGPLYETFKPEVTRALNMMRPSTIIKISFMMENPAIEGVKLGYVTAVPPETGAIRNGGLWLVPPPRYSEDAPESTHQVGMIYLGGTQAEVFSDFLKQVNGDKGEIDRAIAEYVQTQYGIDPSTIIGHAEIAQWIPNPGNSTGRFGYTYIAPDNQPVDFNPRAVFNQSVVEGAQLYLAGEAYTDESATLTSGALKSGKKVAQLIS